MKRMIVVSAALMILVLTTVLVGGGGLPGTDSASQLWKPLTMSTVRGGVVCYVNCSPSGYCDPIQDNPCTKNGCKWDSWNQKYICFQDTGTGPGNATSWFGYCSVMEDGGYASCKGSQIFCAKGYWCNGCTTTGEGAMCKFLNWQYQDGHMNYVAYNKTGEHCP